MVELLDAVGAKGVSAMDQNAWDALANVVLEAAKLADIKTTRLIVQVHYVHFFTMIAIIIIIFYINYNKE